MKRVLIISPHFSPANTADMQRVRTSLPYFAGFGWETEVVMVNERFSHVTQDSLLLQTIPEDIIIHKVKAFDKKWTSKFGLGSLALRSIYFYRRTVDRILKAKSFDLIYFSTTEFPVCILGAYWKKKFKVPYVIDMQDPWHSDFYKNKPKSEQPKKYWFSYRLNKYLEPIAMKNADGLISVSKAYLDVLENRYAVLKTKPKKVITFGGFINDLRIAAQVESTLKLAEKQFINLVYVGRAGHDMKPALEILFSSFNKGLSADQSLFKQIRFHFFGTSYAPNGKGEKTIEPLAGKMGIGAFVSEYTDRIPYYEGLNLLQKADGLIMIGSESPAYTASKLFSYILAKKPLLAIFHSESSSARILKDCKAGDLINLKQDLESSYVSLFNFIQKIQLKTPIETNWNQFEPYTSKSLTKEQTDLFNQVIS